MKTVDIPWIDCSSIWYQTIKNVNVEPLIDAFQLALEAENKVASVSDIGTVRLDLSLFDIEELDEKRRKMVYFCNAIHYEISQLVDNPFGIRMGELLDEAFSLDPQNFKLREGTPLWWGNMKTLKELLIETIIDEQLKKDFEMKCKDLDEDMPSKSLQDAIKELKFWEKEFAKSDQWEEIAAAHFSDNIRNKWATMTEEQRKKVIEAYIYKLDKAFIGKETSVGYDAPGYGVCGGSHLRINEQFVKDATKEYSVDKVIDTLNHEMRHRYQNLVKKNPAFYGISDGLAIEWGKTYIPYDINKKNFDDYYRQDVERDARAVAGLSSPEK